jgi:uncharacterized membrane protein YdcZ (DUF606 family)
LLGRYCITSAASLALFALLTFRIGSLIYTQANLDCETSLDCDTPIYASCIAGMTGTFLLLVEMGLCELFAWVGLNCDLPHLCLPNR